MNRDEMLRKVQMLSFIVVDVGLFLDTHPNDRAALRYYEKYRNLCNEAKEEYERNFGPLTTSGVNIKDNWSWIEMPWPWQGEA